MVLIAIQVGQLNKKKYRINLCDLNGKIIEKKQLKIDSTITYFNTETLYKETYLIYIYGDAVSISKKVIVKK